MEKIIWNDLDVSYDDWKEDFVECFEYEPKDNELCSWVDDCLSDYFNDELYNLDIETEGRIIAIADLGLWNKRCQGYKLLDCNVKDILYSGTDSSDEYKKFYGDGQDIRAIGIHHDGRNKYLYRELREDEDVDILVDIIYYGKQITDEILNKYTKSLYPYVANVYGW